MTSGRDEVPASFEGKEIDRRSARLACLAAANLEDARAPHADPEAGECGYKTIEDVARKPVRSDVTSRHQAAIISASSSRSQSAGQYGEPSCDSQPTALPKRSPFVRSDHQARGLIDPTICPGQARTRSARRPLWTSGPPAWNGA